MLWAHLTRLRERKGNDDSFPPHVLFFSPQLFWSERIPLRVLGAFSSASATTAANFQFQYEACLGAGPDRKEKKKISLILCDEGTLLPTSRTRKTGLLLEFFLSISSA